MSSHNSLRGADLSVLTESDIGSCRTKNRFVRSATSETLADDDGRADPEAYIDLYGRLAAGQVGLIFTGHNYVLPSGKYTPGMCSMHDDGNESTYGRTLDAIHRYGAKMFVQLNHAGSQSRIRDLQPAGPSPIRNPQTGRMPRTLTSNEIEDVVSAFSSAALRAVRFGFDGIHIHAGHGYLISEFLSPHSNKRTDDWGGSLPKRQRLLIAILEEIRRTVGNHPLSVKLGLRDYVDGGLSLEEGSATAVRLDQLGLVNAIEPSAALTSHRIESSMQYAGVSRKQALKDKMVHRLFAKEVPEAYLLPLVRSLKGQVSCRLIAMGGLRRVETMEAIVRNGDADFVSLARPLIREPDLVAQITEGRRGPVDCVSCNICAMHEGIHPLKCWRKSNIDLLNHAFHRISGKLKYH